MFLARFVKKYLQALHLELYQKVTPALMFTFQFVLTNLCKNYL